MQIDQVASSPLETLHIDHYGPLPETEGKQKYVFLVVDAFTRFTWLFPTRSTGTQVACDCLRTIFNTFGAPTLLVSDRGSTFTSIEFNRFVEEFKITHQKVVVASPWANGMAERVNRFIKSSLTKVVDVVTKWRSYLGHTQYVINNTYLSGIRSSPSKLMLGFEQRNHTDRNLSDFVKALEDIDSDMNIERKQQRDMAITATNKLREYNKMYYDANHKTPTKYKTGDLILIRELQSKQGKVKSCK